ncbi:MAG TPA: class IV adenylate cyclase [Candidatus Krumholzibacteria bacterium]|nr:class IV adenylate cyclase [Candidatus Krumholzibacteria bacterium]
MPRNVEIKARLDDPAAVRARALALADGPPVVIEQTDTFYVTDAGRLKLREFADGSGELIQYDRPDATGPKTSTYALAPVGDAAALARVLAAALPVRGVVRKRRELLMAGRTRIHLDQVEGLGAFLELEVVLEADDPLASGEQEAAQLVERLGLDRRALVQGAYIDLIEQSRRAGI